MKNILPPPFKQGMRLPALSFLGLILATTAQNSKGAITLTFEETGGNVIATFSGSIDLVGLNRRFDNFGDSRGGVFFEPEGVTILGQVADGLTADYYGGGNFFTRRGTRFKIVPSVSPDLNNVSESIGYSGNTVIVPGTVPFNGVYTIGNGQTVTWVGETLVSIGVGDLTTSPRTVWKNPNALGTAGEIQFVSVPEPCSLSLAGFSGLALLRRRR